MKIFFLVIQFLISPVSSWDKIKKKGLTAHQHEKYWFYPLLSIVAASAFAQMFYGESLSASLIQAVVFFTTFFLSNMLCPVLLSFLLPLLQEEGKKVFDTDLKIFTMLHLSVLATVTIIQNFLPAQLPPLYIFPIYLLYTISKCAECLGVTSEDKKLTYVICLFLVLIVVPFALLAVLWQFIPVENNL